MALFTLLSRRGLLGNPASGSAGSLKLLRQKRAGVLIASALFLKGLLAYALLSLARSLMPARVRVFFTTVVFTALPPFRIARGAIPVVVGTSKSGGNAADHENSHKRSYRENSNDTLQDTSPPFLASTMSPSNEAVNSATK